MFQSTLEPQLQQRLLPVPSINGWLGADIATSIQGTGTDVWLFGDTLVGTLSVEGQRVISSIPRNSVGIETNGSVRHYWRPEGLNATGGFFNNDSSEEKGSWLWPLTGVAVKNTLFVFAAIVQNEPKNLGPFKFSVIGTKLIVVADYCALDPMLWKPQMKTLPFSSHALQFGAATVVTGDHLYLLGRNESSRRNESSSGGVLMRVLLSNLFDNSCIDSGLANCSEFFTLSGWSPRSSAVELKTVMEKAPTETTITWNVKLSKFVMLDIPAFSTSVFARFSDQLEGPWSTMKELFVLPSPYNDTSRFFCYAPKMHPEIGPFIWTFNSNAFKLSNLVSHIEIYTPQFVQTSLM